MTKPRQTLSWISRTRRGVAGAALAAAVALASGLMAAPSTQAQTFSALHTFKGVPDGAYPYAGLVRDTAGNLYSTTMVGGHHSSSGTMFKVSKTGKESVLYNFEGVDGATDGASPDAGLIRDATGNFYGTTSAGGAGDCDPPQGCGTVFKVSKTGKETVLYKFAGGYSDGCHPAGGLIQDKSGNLYGTTSSCGVSNEGTVFKVSASGKETVLHSFAGSDGAIPMYTSLLMDTSGNLYGFTSAGGAGGGTVYKLSPSGTVTVLYSFPDGYGGAYGTPIMDTQGNLYGTTLNGGYPRDGIVWKLSKKGAETILHQFTRGSSDGAFPYSGVILDANGNLYGTTLRGGSSDDGTVYELTADGTLTLLYSFTNQSDGEYPYGGVIMDAQGNLYGTAEQGGDLKCGTEGYYGCGTVWQITP
jgi:uncharacterized repeat protein (TIGR03803 family)